jgi:hypothetical protein
MAKGRFNSKHQALQMAIHTWVCQNCGVQYKKRKPVVCRGCGSDAFFHFDSVGEANKYAELAMMQNYGLISELELQVPFPLYFDVINGIPVLTTKKRGKPHRTYFADFVYCDEKGKKVILDYKGDVGHVTDVFKLKRKDVEKLYQVEIKLV